MELKTFASDLLCDVLGESSVSHSVYVMVTSVWLHVSGVQAGD